MRAAIIIFLLAEPIFALSIAGCGAKPDALKKVESHTDSRLISFTNILQNAETDYEISFRSASAEIHQAFVISTNMPSNAGHEQEIIDDYLKNMWIFGFGDCITNAQNAIALIQKADPNFQYSYTTYKALPSSFKDDFFRMKDLINKNLIFIESLKQDGLDNKSLQEWMDGNTKIEESYDSVSLEIKRLQ